MTEPSQTMDTLPSLVEWLESPGVHVCHFATFRPMEQKLLNLEWFLFLEKWSSNLKYEFFTKTLKLSSLVWEYYLNGWPYRRFDIRGPMAQSPLVFLLTVTEKSVLQGQNSLLKHLQCVAEVKAYLNSSWWPVKRHSNVVYLQKEYNKKYDMTSDKCFLFVHHNNWSRWFAISSPSPICCPNIIGRVAKK